ncbi:hypothetical protein JVU11DRAFT_1112 [Chiua virens]|nr:hypothetical protein JVU11DRAFT_1112 [Chiua virens]
MIKSTETSMVAFTSYYYKSVGPLAVPPSLVFYTARNILSPSFILGQIPDLFNLLTSIETFRRFAVLKAGEALGWQRYYEIEKTHGHAEDVRLLEVSEVHTLQCFIDSADAQRNEYIVLIQSLVPLYIHYLWTAGESCLLPQRLNDFFPGSMGVETPSSLLFHDDLSDDEKEIFGQFRLACKGWFNLVLDWQEKRRENCQQKGCVRTKEQVDESFKNDFHAVFPQPFQSLQSVQNVEDYMKKVETMIGELEKWFSPRSNM